MTNVNDHIGNYVVTAELGGGGFASVYQGKHLYFLDEPIVAIKLLHARSNSQKALEQFLQEANLLKKLHHPHILPIIEAGQYEHSMYLVIEYAPKGSLRDRLDRQPAQPLPIDEACMILSQIGEALDYAHQHNIIHRDLKPENILFNSKGEVLLADFGMAVVLSSGRTQQVDGIDGTGSYMAPEQFKGIISTKSDQYALGCIAYELFTGQQPFAPAHIEAMWFQHAKVNPTSPRELNPNAPVIIEQAILKAMAKERADRYDSVPTFIKDLHKYKVQPPNEKNIVLPKPSPLLTVPDPLTPGTILRGGRYRLQELQERQEWLGGVYESRWIAQDAQRGGFKVMITEIWLPESSSMVVQSMLRSAVMALTSVGRHPHIMTLSDAFGDRGRHFFVFEPSEGKTLSNHIKKIRSHPNGRAMSEENVIECCLQMAEMLELLAQQSPPLVHGLIHPGHIFIIPSESKYVLTHFSIVLAGGATQFVSGIESRHLSVYSAPEFVRGVIDTRTDLFSLMATAYYSITGSEPMVTNGYMPEVNQLNPNITPGFNTVLAKGLHPIASQRYQRPSELRQDLLAVRKISERK